MENLPTEQRSKLTSETIACSTIYFTIALLNLGNRRLRRRNAKAFQKLVRSIKHFGIVRPILIDQHNNVIDGHGVIEAAMELGIAKVPAIVIDHLAEEDLRALGIALNKLQELGEWNEEVLAQELQFISELNTEYDLELTGLELGEIEFLISDEDAAKSNDQPDPSDDVELATLETDYDPVSREGDLFLIKGNSFEHRVYCGDARSKKGIVKALGNWDANMVLTDPPFDVPVQGHVGGLGKTKHREFVMGSGELGPRRFYKLLLKSIKRYKKALTDGGLAYVFMDKNGLEALLRAGREAGLKLHSICVWRKTNAGMGSLYRSQNEFVVIFKKGKAPHINNVDLGKYGRYRTTDWHYAGFNTFSKERQELFKLHPTLKPVRMLSDAIRDVTRRGDVVLDSFAGAGSTLIAAEKTGRRSVSIELDPIYVDTILKRFEKEFGVEAVHAGTGLTFSQLSEERRSEGLPEAEMKPSKAKPGRIRTRKSLTTSSNTSKGA